MRKLRRVIESRQVEILAFVLLLLILIPTCVSATEYKPGDYVPTIIICQSADAFEQVILTESEEDMYVIASSQLATGHCVRFPEVVGVKVEKPVKVFYKDNAVFTVWKVVSNKDMSFFVFTVEELGGA